MITVNHLPGRTLRIDQKEYLFFSGTSYLGIGHQPLFREALIRGFEQYGTIFSASRNNNLQLDIYEQAEQFLAQWTGSNAALTVTSGLLAGQLAVQSLVNQRFIYTPSVHPALWKNNPATDKTYSFKDYNHFASTIAEKVVQEKSPVVICCNSIDPLRCQPLDFSWVSQLPHNQHITLIFDDSHAIGLVDSGASTPPSVYDGAGHYRRIRELAPSGIKVVVIASLAKALGIPGGVILGDTDMIQTVRNNPMFVGASPIVPAYLYAFLATQGMYSTARQLLRHNITLFKSLNHTILSHFQYLPHYPIFYTSHNELYNELFNRQIMISSFPYPKPNDPPITRIVLSALHTEGDIKMLSEVLLDRLKNT